MLRTFFPYAGDRSRYDGADQELVAIANLQLVGSDLHGGESTPPARRSPQRSGAL
jgi:hypothetical protein